MGVVTGAMTATSYEILLKETEVPSLEKMRQAAKANMFRELTHPGPGNLRSAGWVNPLDTFDYSVDNVVFEAGEFVLFRFRIDEVKVNKTQAKFYAAKRIKEAGVREGRLLTKLEKKDLYEDVIDEMATGVKPVIKIIDVAWDTWNGRLHIFSTSRGDLAEIEADFSSIAGVYPLRYSPYTIAHREFGEKKADDILYKLKGVDSGASPVSKVAHSLELWSSFLMWLGYSTRDTEVVNFMDTSAEVWFIKQLKMASTHDDGVYTLKCDSPLNCEVGLESLRQGGAMIESCLEISTTVNKIPQKWTLTIDVLSGRLKSVKVPNSPLELDVEKINDRLTSLSAAHATLGKMLSSFLLMRFSDRWEDYTKSVAEWLEVDLDS
jgi:hypothetical protein